MWEITDRGFLPTADPIKTLVTNKDYHYGQAGCDPYITHLEAIPAKMANWIEGRRLREELVHAVKEITPYMVERHFDYVLKRTPNDECLERLMHLFSYMASAYVYARYENPATRIPAEIAIPLVRVSQLLDRKPILSYASYCLTNWERMDPGDEIKLGNIKLLSNFCAQEVGKKDEDWFILVHVDIEKAAADGIAACQQLLNQSPVAGGEAYANDILTKLFVSLAKMNKTLAKMPDECSPDNYFRWVRPYIFSFNNVVYEGCFNNQPQTFRGETGAQSSIIPAFLAALEIKHQNSMLTHHLAEMRDYMPAPHRRFLSNLEEMVTNYSGNNVGLRAFAQQNPTLKEIYNECVNEVIRFRNQHFEYAVNYISKKVENPAGTGGTPYVPWLKQLREETESHLLP